MLKVIMEEGLVFLCVGMGVVGLFLSLMVCVMMLSAKVSAWLSKFFPEQAAEASVKKTVVNNDAEIAAAIAIAKVRG